MKILDPVSPFFVFITNPGRGVISFVTFCTGTVLGLMLFASRLVCGVSSINHECVFPTDTCFSDTVLGLFNWVSFTSSEDFAGIEADVMADNASGCGDGGVSRTAFPFEQPILNYLPLRRTWRLVSLDFIAVII